MSPTRRKFEKDKWMPPRVYKGRSAYEYHPSSGGNIRLCSLSATKADVWMEYEKHHNANSKKGSISFLIEEYFKDEIFLELAPETQKDYRDCKKKIKAAFGKMKASDLKPQHVRQFMNLRGKTSKIRANREKTFLSNVMSWGYNYGHNPSNPCFGIKAFKLKARDRYVTDEEYQAVYDLAPPNLKAVMEVAYLCAARSGDIRTIQLSDIKSDGLLIEQNKTGKKQKKLWTSRLKAAIALAKKQPSDIKSISVIHNKQGQPYSASGLKGSFGKLIDKAMGICRKRGNETAEKYAKRKALFEEKYPPIINERFGLHDLKAKSISDYEGDKQYFSGHKTKSMTERYNRTYDNVETLEPKAK